MPQSDARDARRTILRERLKRLHDLWMRAEPGSADDQRYDRLIRKTEAGLDEIFREEEEDWGRDDDRLLRQWADEAGMLP